MHCVIKAATALGVNIVLNVNGQGRFKLLDSTFTPSKLQFAPDGEQLNTIRNSVEKTDKLPPKHSQNLKIVERLRAQRKQFLTDVTEFHRLVNRPFSVFCRQKSTLAKAKAIKFYRETVNSGKGKDSGFHQKHLGD